jgi:hypothetical protein
MRLQFSLLVAVSKDIVTIGGKLDGGYARNGGRSYTGTAYDRITRPILPIRRRSVIGQRMSANPPGK